MKHLSVMILLPVIEMRMMPSIFHARYENVVEEVFMCISVSFQSVGILRLTNFGIIFMQYFIHSTISLTSILLCMQCTS